jgi:hypothetical protein
MRAEHRPSRTAVEPQFREWSCSFETDPTTTQNNNQSSWVVFPTNSFTSPSDKIRIDEVSMDKTLETLEAPETLEAKEPIHASHPIKATKCWVRIVDSSWGAACRLNRPKSVATGFWLGISGLPSQDKTLLKQLQLDPLVSVSSPSAHHAANLAPCASRCC